jgi:hypothetical protein
MRSGGFHLPTDISENVEGVTAVPGVGRYGLINPLWVLNTAAWNLGKLSWGGAACLGFTNLPWTAARSSSAAYPGTGGQSVGFSLGGGMPVVYVNGTLYSDQDYNPARLANKGNAFCVLSDVRGGFLGAGDSVAIKDFDSQGRQYLSVRAATGDLGATAFATCIYYDQINPPDPAVEPFQ